MCIGIKNVMHKTSANGSGYTANVSSAVSVYNVDISTV